MAYTTQSGVIGVGKPVKKSITSNMDDALVQHESDIASLQAAGARIVIFSSEIVGFDQNVTATYNRIALFKADQNIRITNVKVYVLHQNGTAPTAGTLEIDILKGDLTTNPSIFNTLPNVTTFGDGDVSGTEDFTMGGENILQGQFLELNITSLQTGQTRIFVDVFAVPV